MRAARPSLTARWVAAQRASLAATRPAGPDGDIDAERRLYDGFSRWLRVPALRPMAMVARTRFFDDEVVTAIGAGVGQVVLVGAGYDGRALRFACDGVRWIEVDHPATQVDKRRRLQALGVPLDHMSFAGVDLVAGDLGAALHAAGHVAERPTLFTCEGLFAYLPRRVGGAVCRSLRSRAAPGSVLAANFRLAPEAGASASLARGFVDAALAAIGERRLDDFRPDDPDALFVSAGWKVVRRTSTAPERLGGGTQLLALAAEPAASEGREPGQPVTPQA